MIRSSCHSLKFSNNGKRKQLNRLLEQYSSMVKKYTNIVWNNNPLENTQTMLPSKQCNQIKTERTNNSRLRQAAAKQACSSINSVWDKRRKQVYMLKKLQREGVNAAALQSIIDTKPITKPVFKGISMELDSRFVDMKEVDGKFNLFIKLKQIGNKENINIPIKYNKVSLKWLKKGTLKTSIRIKNNNLYLFYDVPDVPKKTSGEVLGADQGLVTCLTLSDGQATKINSHGYDLNKIVKVLSRRKKGSVGFREAATHRTNYIHWSINQLDFSNTKEVRFEKHFDSKRGKRLNKFLIHWPYPLIKDKMLSLSEEKGFQIVESNNVYKSQRCSQCGWTKKSNRKGKLFKCSNVNCGFATDSDLNAALNNSIDLIDIPYQSKLRQQRLNLNGFFWYKDSIVVDEESIVPHSKKLKIMKFHILHDF